MSEPIAQAIPTSADTRTQRPVKRMRGPNTATAQQAYEVENLMYDPNTPIEIPALSKDTKSALPPPPEFVANVQGSSAGAGSGEFHVYKNSRRREYERLRAMDEEAEEEQSAKQWEEERDEKKRRDEERMSKNRARRNKRKQNKTKDGSVGPELASNVKEPGISIDGRKSFQIPTRQENEPDGIGTDGAVVPDAGITIHDDD